MAAPSDSELDNAEIDSEKEEIVDLNEFLENNSLPECICVTQGTYLSKSVQISDGDVLLLKSIECDSVTISYKEENDRSWTDIKVSLDSSQRFKVLPPKDALISSESRERAASMVFYPAISDLLLDCPTYFEATASYEDPYLPGMSISAGDKFRFEKIVSDTRDGQQRLRVRDVLDNAVQLSLDCKGNFCPLEDDQTYTLKELVDSACVPRRLKLVPTNQTSEDGGSSTLASSSAPSLTIDASALTKPKPRLPRSTASSTSSSFSSCSGASKVVSDILSVLPASFSGAIHMLKPEKEVLVSPFNDPDTVWSLPVSASLKVRLYGQNDYEVPARRPSTPPFAPPPVPLPLSPTDGVPKYKAPTIPAMQQPVIPVNITSFADLYSGSFPVTAKLCDVSECNTFLRDILEDVKEVIVYRRDESRRLFAKNTKNDDVFSLSKDLQVGFIEYPEKFQSVFQLLHLPLGTEVTVLEDIAADFPKPFFLRFGDIIRITSNTAYSVKLKHSSQDCEVLKCEKCSPEGGDSVKLRIPLDFELSMVIASDAANKKVLRVPDLLSGRTLIPRQPVASLPPDQEKELLEELPVDLQLLSVIKEPCLVVSPTMPFTLPASFTSMFTSAPQVPSSSVSSQDSCSSAAACSSSEPRQVPQNIGLPLNSNIVLALTERISLEDVDLLASEADFVRTPMEKLSRTKFEELEKCSKLTMTDLSNVAAPGSNNSLDLCGAGNGVMLRTGSTGRLEVQGKRRKLDKVRRLSRALNPKHWRHSKADPEPLPHPSAMGLMALASRPNSASSNDYQFQQQQEQQQQQQLEQQQGSAETASTEDGSTVSSDEDAEDNLYEDVEIGPLRSSTFDAPPTSQKPRLFSGRLHKSLPLPRLRARLVARKSSPRSNDDPVGGAEGGASRNDVRVTNNGGVEEGHEDFDNDNDSESHIYDIPSPVAKEKSWKSTLERKFQQLKPRYDVPKSSNSRPKPDVVAVSKNDSEDNDIALQYTAVDRSRPREARKVRDNSADNIIKASEKSNLSVDGKKAKALGNTADTPPVAPTRRKAGKEGSREQASNNGKLSSTQAQVDNSGEGGFSDAPTPPRRTRKVRSMNDSPADETRNSSTHSEGSTPPPPPPPPRPKPRGVKKSNSSPADTEAVMAQESDRDDHVGLRKQVAAMTLREAPDVPARPSVLSPSHGSNSKDRSEKPVPPPKPRQRKA
ncbi:uncharacterized protein LOC101845015 [Aplysia californica]|uniref:Uncharacterized protein LOC101845015 n=1 Tax=Aplysia californica TaxID=6500 RepID=A0ABM0JW82_APLCA|nr:uncharacterized protein LOC101845015 [Aplysia californica]